LESTDTLRNISVRFGVLVHTKFLAYWYFAFPGSNQGPVNNCPDVELGPATVYLCLRMSLTTFTSSSVFCLEIRGGLPVTDVLQLGTEFGFGKIRI